MAHHWPTENKHIKKTRSSRQKRKPLWLKKVRHSVYRKKKRYNVETVILLPPLKTPTLQSCVNIPEEGIYISKSRKVQSKFPEGEARPGRHMDPYRAEGYLRLYLDRSEGVIDYSFATLPRGSW